MPHHTRASGRKRKASVTEDVDGQGLGNKRSRSGAANTKGFPALPTELLLAIFSYIPSLPVPATADDVKTSYRCRARLLRGLSQMCSHLRFVFRAMAWELIEVLDTDLGYVDPNTKKKLLATELIRQLDIVTVQDATLSAYVKTVNVMLTDYSCENIMKEFARCLSLFSNLETIQIIAVDDKLTPNPKHIKEAFGDYQYPSTIFATYSGWGLGVFAPTLERCPKIQKFCGVLRDQRWDVLDILDIRIEDMPMRQGHPQTKRLTIEGRPTDRYMKERSFQAIRQTILAFKAMSPPPPNLASIEYIPNASEGEIWFSVWSTMLVEAAEMVLRQSVIAPGSLTHQHVYLRYTNAVRSFTFDAVTR